jgi:carbonyl reductase 1
MKPEKRHALVTGANRGLGYEVCRQLARNGFNVILTSRDAREGQSAVRRLGGEGLPVEYRRLDVIDRPCIAGLVADLAAGGTQIDVLVNNAAVSLSGFNAEVARMTLAVNFFGAMHVTDALADRIVDGGSVIMVSSGMGELSGLLSASLRAEFEDGKLTREKLVGLMHRFIDDVAAGRHEAAGWPSSAYRVSKVGLNALTRILARDPVLRRIRVNSTSPGWVRTRMGGASVTSTVETGAASIVWPALADRFATGGFYRDGRQIDW